MPFYLTNTSWTFQLTWLPSVDFENRFLTGLQTFWNNPAFEIYCSDDWLQNVAPDFSISRKRFVLVSASGGGTDGLTFANLFLHSRKSVCVLGLSSDVQ